jgi:hypothetical protein
MTAVSAAGCASPSSRRILVQLVDGPVLLVDADVGPEQRSFDVGKQVVHDGQRVGQ